MRHFRPSLRATLLSSLALLLFLSLAHWQWRRAEEKRQLLARWEAQIQKEPLLLNKISWEEVERFQPVQVQGRFDLDHPIWLANRFSGGRLGYELLIPFQIEGRGTSLLVNLGWTPLVGGDPKRLPEIPPLPKGKVQIEGIIDHFPALGLYLEGGEKIRGWPAVVSWLSREEIERSLGRPVLPWQLKLSPELPFGLERRWTIQLYPSPERHVGYALQWLSFALVTLFLWFFSSWKRS